MDNRVVLPSPELDAVEESSNNPRRSEDRKPVDDTFPPGCDSQGLPVGRVAEGAAPQGGLGDPVQRLANLRQSSGGRLEAARRPAESSLSSFSRTKSRHGLQCSAAKRADLGSGRPDRWWLLCTARNTISFWGGHLSGHVYYSLGGLRDARDVSDDGREGGGDEPVLLRVEARAGCGAFPGLVAGLQADAGDGLEEEAGEVLRVEEFVGDVAVAVVEVVDGGRPGDSGRVARGAKLRERQRRIGRLGCGGGSGADLCGGLRPRSGCGRCGNGHECGRCAVQRRWRGCRR